MVLTTMIKWFLFFFIKKNLTENPRKFPIEIRKSLIAFSGKFQKHFENPIEIRKSPCNFSGNYLSYFEITKLQIRIRK